MIAIVAVPFFDTEENDRSGLTIETLAYLRDTLQPRHKIVPVDNGSTDRTTYDWLVQYWPPREFLWLKEPHSIAEGVNAAWRTFEHLLNDGRAVAVKHDSDLSIMPSDGAWIEEILAIFEEYPDVYLAGVRGSVDQSINPEWILEDHNHWFVAPFVPGGCQARSPLAWRDIGYSRQPYGRWGWGDHWDAFRVDYLKKKCALLWNYTFDHKHKGALMLELRETHVRKALGAFEVMIQEVIQGTRPVREEFEPWSP